MWKRYLFWFAQEHVDFRHAEIQSLLSLFKIDMRWVEKPIDKELYWVVELASEENAKKIASRSISLRWCLELWGRSKTSESLHQNMKISLKNTTQGWCKVPSENGGELNAESACDRTLMDPYFAKEKSFRFSVETFCRHFTLQEKIQKIETFSYLPLEGKIKLKNPETEIFLIEHYGLDPNNIPEEAQDLFIGRLVAEGQRQLITKLSLKTRKFIGNTSMDAQLSVLMANQAQISNCDLVLDPFVGSGSLLVAAAEFGGYVWGTDIDYMMLHAKTRPTRVTQKKREKDESIRANMCQYRTQHRYLDVLVSDFSLPIWKDTMRFNAIITDPPYGIREPTERIGIDKENYSLTSEHMSNHIPAKVDYDLSHIYSDLLHFSAKHLQLGRRLVCWFPYYRDDYKLDRLPTHKCLELIANSEQVLSQLTARRLLTYEKTLEFIPDEAINGSNEFLDNEDFLERNGAKENTPDSEDGLYSDFRQRYFNSGEHTRKERREQRAKDKEHGRIQKEIRLKREESKGKELK